MLVKIIPSFLPTTHRTKYSPVDVLDVVDSPLAIISSIAHTASSYLVQQDDGRRSP